MRVVQVANFYGPRSGGLRTAVDRLGAEYCARGHEVFLVVPGPQSEWHELPSGVVRISLPARLIPFTGGYRAVLPGPVTSLLTQLAPDALEVSDRLTLRSLGEWGRRHDVATVMISHERLDRLVGQILPRPRARVDRRRRQSAHRRRATTPWCARRRSRGKSSTGSTPSNVLTVPLGVDLDQFHPSRRSASVRQRWARPGTDPAGALRSACRWRSMLTAASIPLPHCETRASTPGSSSWGRARCGRGWNARRPACPSTSPATSVAATPSPPSWRPPTSHWRRARTRRSGWPRWRRWHAAHPRWCRAPRRWPRS